MATIREWIEGGDHLDAETVKQYRQRARRADGTAWLAIHGLPPLVEIIGHGNVTPAPSDHRPPPNPRKATVVASNAASTGGPGTELKLLLAELGVQSKESCGCNKRAAEMDAHGTAVVRQHKDTWVRYVTEQYHAASWWTCAKASAIAVTHGFPLTIEGLIEEACRRADAKKELAK